MPPPHGITSMGASAQALGPIALAAGPPGARAGGNMRTFHPYLELTMQSKHDAVIRGYCNQVAVVGRRADGTQCNHNFATAPLAFAGYYNLRAQVAAEVVKTQMEGRWAGQAQGPRTPVFTRPTPGALGSTRARVDASVQNTVQRDNHQYDISYWYDGPDIYVLFHCYPSR